MAFSNLTSLTAAQYQALNLTPMGNFNTSSIGSPDSRVGIQLGGWVGNNVLAFTISNAANSASGTAIDTRATDTIDINVSTGTNPAAVISYWTVNVGSDNRTSQWTVTYDVKSNNTETGKWVFTKGKTDDDIYPQ